MSSTPQPRSMSHDELDPNSLPPPSDEQRALGWKHDYASVWASHDAALLELRDDASKLNLFQTSPTQTDESGRRLTVYDFTGGHVVKKAKELARRDEIEHEDERLKQWWQDARSR